MLKLKKRFAFLICMLLIFVCLTPSFAEATYPCNGTVLKPDVNVRKEADSKSDRLYQLEKNEIVTVLHEKNNGKVIWYYIEYGNNRNGYVRGDLIKLEKNDSRSIIADTNVESDWSAASVYQKYLTDWTPPKDNDWRLKRDFEFYDCHDKSEYGYMTVSARVKNESLNTYEFVRVKAIFRDKNEEILDTNWTYLVTDEGLEPQESKTFSIMIPYNKNIATYEFTILDYEKR